MYIIVAGYLLLEHTHTNRQEAAVSLGGRIRTLSSLLLLPLLLLSYTCGLHREISDSLQLVKVKVMYLRGAFGGAGYVSDQIFLAPWSQGLALCR